MNILFVWTGITGYMGDAWRTLAQTGGVRLKVLIQARRRESESRFDSAVTLRELDCTVVYGDERFDIRPLDEQVQLFRPDVVFIVGWHARLSRHFAMCRGLAQVPKVLVFDLPLEWSLKKLVAPFVLRPYLRHFCGCFVPGERAAAYARWLGFKDGAGLGWIEERLFCANVRKFEGLSERRLALPSYPRQFLFVGRYVKAKGLPVLVAAYRRYQALLARQGGDAPRSAPWGLTCCGMGPLGGLLAGVEGVRDAGFVQPDELPDLFLSHGAFVLASIHEPWGVVLAEAAAAGLPIVCTRACGASQDVVKDNGIVCETGDDESLAQALLRIHRMADAERAEMGKRGKALAERYSCEAWATRVVAMSMRIKANEGAALCSVK